MAVTTPSGGRETRFHDSAGRVVQVIDPLGAVTRFEYDALNQVTTVIDARAGETTFTDDGNGNLLTLTDARGHTTAWTYDPMDRVATRTDPLLRQESFTYDLHGNLATWTGRKGQVTTYAYDALDRLIFAGFGTTGAPPRQVPRPVPGPSDLGKPTPRTPLWRKVLKPILEFPWDDLFTPPPVGRKPPACESLPPGRPMHDLAGSLPCST